MALISPRGQERRSRNYMLVRLIAIPQQVMYQIILATTSRYMKDKKVARISKHGFTEWKCCLTSLIAFYHEITSLADEGGAMDVVHLKFIRLLTLSSVRSSQKSR